MEDSTKYSCRSYQHSYQISICVFRVAKALEMLDNKNCALKYSRRLSQGSMNPDKQPEYCISWGQQYSNATYESYHT